MSTCGLALGSCSRNVGSLLPLSLQEGLSTLQSPLTEHLPMPTVVRHFITLKSHNNSDTLFPNEVFKEQEESCQVTLAACKGGFYVSFLSCFLNFETGSCQVAQAMLTLAIFLPQAQSMGLQGALPPLAMGYVFLTTLTTPTLPQVFGLHCGMTCVGFQGLSPVADIN